MLEKENLANHIHVARDGEEALEFLFCNGPHVNRSFRPSTPIGVVGFKTSQGRRDGGAEAP